MEHVLEFIVAFESSEPLSDEAAKAIAERFVSVAEDAAEDFTEDDQNTLYSVEARRVSRFTRD